MEDKRYRVVSDGEVCGTNFASVQSAKNWANEFLEFGDHYEIQEGSFVAVSAGTVLTPWERVRNRVEEIVYEGGDNREVANKIMAHLAPYLAVKPT